MMNMIDFWIKNIELVKHDPLVVNRIIEGGKSDKEKEDALRDYCLRCEKADELAFDNEWRAKWIRLYGYDPMGGV